MLVDLGGRESRRQYVQSDISERIYCPKFGVLAGRDLGVVIEEIRPHRPQTPVPDLLRVPPVVGHERRQIVDLAALNQLMCSTSTGFGGGGGGDFIKTTPPPPKRGGTGLFFGGLGYFSGEKWAKNPKNYTCKDHGWRPWRATIFGLMVKMGLIDHGKKARVVFGILAKTGQVYDHFGQNYT